MKYTTETTQNLLRLPRSVDESSVKLGLKIRQNHPVPESIALLASYLKLYQIISFREVSFLDVGYILKLNHIPKKQLELVTHSFGMLHHIPCLLPSLV